MATDKCILPLLLCCLWGDQACASDRDQAFLLELSFESLLQVRVSVASPFEEKIADAAASVAVLTPNDWQKRGAKSVEDALEQVPSIVSYPSLGSAKVTAIRGYATELSARGIASLLDGVPLNNFSYATSVYDTPFIPLSLLSRVEVIRGAGSTLYGSDAFHGVLSLTTQRTIESSSRVSALAGSHDSYNLSAVTTVGDKHFSLQSGVALTQHGQQNIDYTYHDPLSNLLETSERDNQLDDKTAFLHLLLGDKSDHFGGWVLSLYGNQYEAQNFSGSGTQFYPPVRQVIRAPNLNFADDHDFGGQDSHFSMMKLKHERLLSQNLMLDVSVYQWQSEQTWLYDFSRYPQTSTLLSGVIVPCRSSSNQTGVSPLFCPHRYYQRSADTRRGVETLLRQESERDQWAIGAGVDWLKVDQAFVQRIGLQQQIYVDNHAPSEGAKRRIDHVFFHARHDFLDGKLSAVYGARWDDYQDIGNAVSPRLGFIYQWNDQWINKLLFSHAFRAPSAAERYGSGAGSQQLDNPNIMPETIDSVEMVVQHQGLEQNTELTLFRSLWKNSIILAPVTSVLNQYQNGGDNNAYGLELSHSRHWKSWQAQASASFVHSENIQSHSEYTAFPSYSFNAGIGRSFVGGWSLWLNEYMLLQQTTTDKLPSEPVVKSSNYYRTDVHLEQQAQHWRYWLDVRNIFNRRNIIPALYNAEGGIPDEKISVVVGLERRW